jgi:phosphatidylserine/phosphatidylglycerophosphate/cardiolipin synthase-like enzyme
MSLFYKKPFKSASGQILQWKIECDALTKKDWECLAYMIQERCGAFATVYGIPTGGEPLAKALEQYARRDTDVRLLVDDVYTTGGSIEKYRQPNDLVWVVFARKRPTHGVKALFVMEH